MFDIITIGDCTVDTYALIDENCPQTHLSSNKKLLCLNYADKISVFEAGEAVGGNAANVAVGMHKLGIKSAIVTELGTDLKAEFILTQLNKEHIHTSLVRQHKRNKTRYSLVLNYRGERTILSYHSERKYLLPSLPSTQWVYYTSLGDGFEQIQNPLIKYLKKHPETKLAVNPGSYQIKNGLNAFKEILPYTDILFVNKEEAEILAGKKLPSKKLVSVLHALGAKAIAITDGSNGSLASNGYEIYSIPVYPVKNISKTGAGDAYASGFLSAILHEHTLSEAMQWGNANSAAVIQHIGAQTGLFNQKQLSTTIKKFSSLKPKIL